MFDILSCHSYFMLFIGDFNAKSKNWSKYDITLAKGAQLDSQQLITEPKYLIYTSFLPTCQMLFQNMEFIHRCTKNVTIRESILIY